MADTDTSYSGLHSQKADTDASNAFMDAYKSLTATSGSGSTQQAPQQQQYPMLQQGGKASGGVFGKMMGGGGMGGMGGMGMMG